MYSVNTYAQNKNNKHMTCISFWYFTNQFTSEPADGANNSCIRPAYLKGLIKRDTTADSHIISIITWQGGAQTDLLTLTTDVM